MGKRKAVAEVVVPASYEAADELMALLGDARRRLAREEDRLADKVAKLTALVEARATPIREEVAGLEAQIAAYAAANRKTLLEGDSKHHDMPAGRFGWRMDPASIEIKSNFTLPGVVKAILKLRLRRRFLRLKLELNKQAMLDDKDTALTVPGIRVKQMERFYIEPVGAKLSGGGK